MSTFDFGSMFDSPADPTAPLADSPAAPSTSSTPEPPRVTSGILSTQSTQECVRNVLTSPVKRIKRTKEIARYVNDFNLPVKDAYQLVTGKTPCEDTVSSMRQKVRELSLTKPTLVKQAILTVSNILQSKPMKQELTTVDRRSGELKTVESKVYPTHSNQIAAAAMVMDRAEPIVRQNVNLNGNLKDFLPFKIDELG